MHKKRRIKKTLKRKFNLTNLSIASLSILTSFIVVSISSSFQQQQISQPSQNNLLYSAVRLADAFDLYNEKRFAKE